MMDMSEKEEYIEKIEKLVYSANKFNEMSFRLVLEGLVNKGGEEAEYLLVRFITSKELDIPTRINIIRVVGYIQSPHFLIPLKKVIDTEDHIHLKKEAVISVSKYNDRRALNILNYALSNIKNTLLLDTINNEISKIKRNNPVFALLPRFLEGEKNPKNFEVTLGILKRILTPTDAAMFASYLNCGKILIERGAFEILCYTADLTQHATILKYFQDRFSQAGCIHDPMCEEIYNLTTILRRYFLRFPSLIEEQLDNLGTQLFYVKDIRVRGLFISIICHSQASPALSFVSKVYDSEPDLRETIIIEYSGNEAAVNLLFEKYRDIEPNLKGLLIQTFLNSRKGIDYFYKHFFTLDKSDQEIVINCLPYGGGHNLSNFFKMILEAERFEMKENLLSKVKDYYEFSVKDILFDPARQSEFTLMEREYLETITRLFPISSIKKMIVEIAYTDVSVSKIKRYFQFIYDSTRLGLAFNLKDKNLTSRLFSKITVANNPELNQLLLNILRYIKTFDLETYANLNEGLGIFTINREKQMSIQEGDEVRKIRKNFSELYLDIRRMEEGLKTLSQVFARKELNFEQLINFFNQQALCVAVHIERIDQYIVGRLAHAEKEEIKEWMQFFNRFPMIAYRLKDAVLQKARSLSGPEGSVLLKFFHALPEKPVKIVIRLTNKQITAVLREQCSEMMPDVPVDTDTDELDEEDMLLCDTVTLKDFILKNTLPSQKLFLFLENISEFESFKTYNPRPFLKPFSAHRIIKEVLKEIYL
jgi:hypothetical protein